MCKLLNFKQISPKQLDVAPDTNKGINMKYVNLARVMVTERSRSIETGNHQLRRVTQIKNWAIPKILMRRGNKNIMGGGKST